MYVKSNRFRRFGVTTYLCLREEISITYSECVSVALVIQHAKLMGLLYCHLWPVWLYNNFLNYLIHSLTFRNIFYLLALRPNAGQGLLINEVAKSHTTTHHSR